MNRFIRASAGSLMFKQPMPRPLQSTFKTNATNCLLRSICGEYIHCCLVCPYGQETSMHAYDDPGHLLLFFHGNADDNASSHSYCKWLADYLHMSVLMCDYPGYGFSSGEPSEEGMVNAAMALMDFATTKLQKQASDIYVMGKSIGSFPAVSLAAHPALESLRGLILVSPVASAARCIFETKYMPHFILQRLDGVALANIKHIGAVCALTLMVHGNNDDIVSVDNTHALMAASSPKAYYPPLFLEAGHNDIECKFSSLFLDTLQLFVKKHEQQLQDSAAFEPYDLLGDS